MAERVRVRNATKYDIGVVTMNGLGYNIKPGTFRLMAPEDVEYNMALAPLLFAKPAQLVVEDDELSRTVGIDDYREATYSDDEIERVLKGTAGKLKTFVEENKENHHILERLAVATEKMDLPASKIRILQEVLPHRDFID